MENKIDLSKIPVKETAKKHIRANFDGTEQDYEIRALTDGERANLNSLLTRGKDVFRVRNIYVCLLSCGLDIDEAVADLLYDNVTAEAMRVGDQIFHFSREFEAGKVREAEDAEKNSKKGAEQPA